MSQLRHQQCCHGQEADSLPSSYHWAPTAVESQCKLDDCRMKAVESGATDEEVEEQFTMQLEQLIKQCDDELGLIPKMAEWKPWDVPAGHKASTSFAAAILCFLYMQLLQYLV